MNKTTVFLCLLLLMGKANSDSSTALNCQTAGSEAKTKYGDTISGAQKIYNAQLNEINNNYKNNVKSSQMEASQQKQDAYKAYVDVYKGGDKNSIKNAEADYNVALQQISINSKRKLSELEAQRDSDLETLRKNGENQVQAAKDYYNSQSKDIVSSCSYGSAGTAGILGSTTGSDPSTASSSSSSSSPAIVNSSSSSTSSLSPAPVSTDNNRSPASAEKSSPQSGAR